MFERGKRDEEQDETADFRSAAPPRAREPASSKSAGSGECAVIGRSIEINGDVRGNEDLRIEGDVSGTVELRNSNLTIGKEGKVRADVYAKSIEVDGMTEGDLYATERINVHISAQVRGNITAPKVGIEEGAKFKGSIEMDQAAVEKAFGKTGGQGNAKVLGDRPGGKPAPKSPLNETAPGASTPAAGVK